MLIQEPSPEFILSMSGNIFKKSKVGIFNGSSKRKSILEGKKLLFKEQFRSFKSTPHFEGVPAYREANRKLQKFFSLCNKNYMDGSVLPVAKQSLTRKINESLCC